MKENSSDKNHLTLIQLNWRREQK